MHCKALLGAFNAEDYLIGREYFYDDGLSTVFTEGFSEVGFSGEFTGFAK